MKAEDIRQATFIELNANENQSEGLSNFLKQGAKLVKEHEKNTKLWFALKKNNYEYAIFDVFPNDAGRAEHFAGQVANALKKNAEKLVVGGWEKGVIPHVANASILSVRLPKNLTTAKAATLIKFKAAAGQAENLAKLLTEAAAIVEKTEPKTLFWVALKFDDETYGIFDIFTDGEGRDQHFAGQVASILKEKAAILVQDGWEKGVVSKVQNFELIAIK
ncbi:MAG: hypothetical protein U1E78_05895 [Gammaproteobacteria bacterium]